MQSEPSVIPPTDNQPTVSSPEPPSRGKQWVGSGLLVLAVLIALSSYVAFHGTSNAPTAPAAIGVATIAPGAVSITSDGFSPSTISIKTGQAVVWTNDDTVNHTVITNDPLPTNSKEPVINSGQALSPTDAYSYVFDKAGTYGYHDNSSGFSGTVIVK
ncbi:MAG TPA: cupredoxin domain-containing protein [Candidatus Saccharimonadales bacterium]